MRRTIGLVLALCMFVIAATPVYAETVIIQATRTHVIHRPGQLPAYILTGFTGRIEAFHASTVTVIWDFAYVNGQLQKDVVGRVPAVMVGVIEVQPD